MTTSILGSSRNPTGEGYHRLGPTQLSGDARSLHRGSVSTVTPSISTSTEECPNQVTRSPDAGGIRNPLPPSITTGTGASGNSPGVDSNERKSPLRVFVHMGCSFTKRPSDHCGESRIRLSRSSLGSSPNVGHPWSNTAASALRAMALTLAHNNQGLMTAHLINTVGETVPRGLPAGTPRDLRL